MKQTKEQKAMALLYDLANLYEEDPKLTKAMLDYFPSVKVFLENILREPMSAQEMFWNLGYVNIDEGEEWSAYWFRYRNINTTPPTEVTFYRTKKGYTCEEYGDIFMVDAKLHQTITQQMKELGWLKKEEY